MTATRQGAMTRRAQHYEQAFDDYLRSRGWPFVPVDQAKRSLLAEATIKSFDFIVYSESGPNLIVDVKGRKFPDSSPGASRGTRAWENWITRDDVEGLRQWQGVFGVEFISVLVFAYWLQGPPARAPFEDVHWMEGRHYAFVALPLEDYVSLATPRSAKWQTLSAAARPFSRAVVPIEDML